jgi:nondiscriminating glutamyl-tRNA synthetase
MENNKAQNTDSRSAESLSKTNQKVRVRFAPSPTGYLHVGGARTALYNYLFAKSRGGEFIIRVEDTDEERSQVDFLKSMLIDLDWLGLTWAEGPQVDLKETGSFGPYRQSERKHIYKEYTQKLLDKGHAYYCFLTDEELEIQREKAVAAGVPFRPDSPYRDWDLKQAEEKLKTMSASIRFKNNYGNQDFKFNDIVRNEISFPADMIGDFVLVRSSGMPVYNFVCTLDDALMKITHVFRAEEHLSNTLKQLMIYEALGFTPPEFGHLSIMLGGDRQKLSKRHGATSVFEFKAQGYLPEALLNFMALVGWSAPSGKEILSVDDMIAEFSIDRFNPASAVFDMDKCKWMNSQYLRALPELELWKRLEPFLKEAGLKFLGNDEWKAKTLVTYKQNMETLLDGPKVLLPLSETPLVVEDEAKEVLTWPKSKDLILLMQDEVTKMQTEYPSADLLDQIMNRAKAELDLKGKFLFMPLRVALIGKAHGTEIKDLFPLLRKDVILNRISSLI